MTQRVRLVNDFEAMSQFTAPGEGINRLAFTDADWAGRQYIIDRMVDAGLTVETDGFGNVIGYKVGKNPDLPVVMVLIRTVCRMVAIMTAWSACYPPLNPCVA